MGSNLIQINAKLQAYTKGILPAFPQPTQYDVGKVLSVDEHGQYTLQESAITKQQADEIISKLATVEVGAQENKIEVISVGGKVLPTTEKQANIPVATLQEYGVVKSSEEENYIYVHPDGRMEVNNLNIIKLIQNDGQDIVLDCSK